MEFPLDHEHYKNLKRLYDKTVKDKKDSFLFNGQQMLVVYAKYCLEHMCNQLKIKP